MVEVPEKASPHEISNEDVVKEPLEEAVNNEGGENTDEEDYSGMPELCDNEHVVAAKASEKSQAVSRSKKSGSSVIENGESSSGQLGEWDDVLGSGRYGWALVPVVTGTSK
jgi:hypothetical protein